MMQLCALLFAYLVASSLASATAPKSECESQAQRTPADFYMGLIKQGLSAQELTAQDLEWLSGQRTPSQPQWVGKNHKNLALRNGFDRVLNSMRRRDWTKVTTLLQAELLRASTEKAQVELSVEATREIFAAIPTKYTIPWNQIFVETFVSSAGDIFVSATDQLDTYVHDVKSGRSSKQEGFYANPALIDFFETTQGRVLYASISDSELRVIDAKTGDELSKHKFPSFGKPPYQPFLYEKDGRVKITLGYYKGAISDAGVSVDLFTIDLLSKEISRQKIMNSETLRFKRLSKNRIFASAIHTPSHPYARSGFKNVFLYDVVEGHYVLNIYSDKIGLNGPLHPYLMDDGEIPTLAFYSPGDLSLPWLFGNPRSGKIERLNFSQLSSDADLISFPDKTIWSVEREKPSYKADSLTLQLKPIRNVDPSKIVTRNFSNFLSPRQHAHTLRLGNKDLISLREVRGEEEVIHFYDRELNEFGSVSLTEKFESPNEPFVNAAEGRIYLFGRSWRGTQPWVLYQIYGPELSR